MEQPSGIPLSKRALTGGGAMYLIKELSNSESEHAVMAMIVIAVVGALYILADGIKEWGRNGIDKDSN